MKPFSWWPQVLNLKVLSWTEPVTFYGMNFLKFDHGQTSGWSNSVLPRGLGAYIFLASAQIISISPFICDDLRKRLSSTKLCKVGAKRAMTKKRWLVQSDLQDKLQTLWWAHTSRQPGRSGRRNKKAFLDRNEMLNDLASSRLDLIAILIAKKKANTHPLLSQRDD